MNQRIHLFCSVVFIVTAICSSTLEAQTRSKEDPKFTRARHYMVETAVRQAGVTDERVLSSMLQTRRHEFVLRRDQFRAYLDAGVPIGSAQTISSPFIVAYMTQMLDPQPTDRVLEIGTGSGYQAAILSPLVKEVYSIEIVEALGKRAAKVLKKLKYENVFTKIGDGYKGWEEHAPFDKVIVTCSPEDVPQPLVDQLREGGLLIVPMGQRHQQTLYLMIKKDGKLVTEALRPTLFVPMTGAAEDARKVKPDPTDPQILNFDFEEGLDEKGFVKGWYYQRRLELIAGDEAPSGEHYVKFSNDVPGQHAHVMQGFAIDGRSVSAVDFEAHLKLENVKRGIYNEDIPVAMISFYDEDRRHLKDAVLDPLSFNKDWHKLEMKSIRVPIATKDAIVRIGMFGATGTAKFDAVKLTVSKKSN
ncbi:protein-L-isoaspartate(D-aspartate) O-methyltransferase [Mariniblastus fucicola]|nr:protein-L-isoaspartate(D-aspartate) O-methyltransferase [Mariniblastus fucicola]